MAGAGHRTGLAVAAVADHGLALLFLFDHADDDCCHDRDQHSADDNCPDIAYDPLEHTLISFDCSASFRGGTNDLSVPTWESPCR